MMTSIPEGLVVDPETGEVVPPEHLAVTYANAVEAVAEAEAELGKLRRSVAALADAVRPLAEAGPLEAGYGRRVVLAPPKRPAQRVSSSACEKHSEVLLDMGIGGMVYKAPGIAVIRERRAELVARGIDPNELAPEPMAGPPTLEVVSLGGES